MRRLLAMGLLLLSACATLPPAPGPALHMVAVDCFDNGDIYEIWQRPDGSRYLRTISPSDIEVRMDIDNVVFLNR